MAATMKDLAKETGLGLATISSYFNGGNVRDKNKQKIEKAIKELGFELNETARGLKTNHTRLIGIIIPELSNAFCGNMVMEIEDILRNYGYGALICDCRSDTKREEEAAEFLLHRRVDGLIIMPTAKSGAFLKRYQKEKKPVIVLDRKIEDFETDFVLVDNKKGVEKGIERLLGAGHRKIGFIAGPWEIYTTKDRFAGYERAMKRHNLPIRDELIAYGDYTIEGGAKAMELLIEGSPDMSAVLVSNYEMTVGAMIALNEKEIVIPRDISFIGYDNLEFARASNPRLAIIKQPIGQMGQVAAKRMVERLSEKESKNRKTIKLDATFVEGKSIVEAPMKQYLLGIDIGTSACKIAIFNRDGERISSTSEDYPIYYPKESWAEQDPREWWEAVCIASKELIKQSGISPKEIAGIGVDGQSWSAIPIDKEGKVLYNTPIWMDTRAEEICNELKKRVQEEEIFELCGNPLKPSYTTPKILWYKKEKPEIYKKIDKILQSNSYIVYKLTDKITQDISQAYGLHCFDMRKGEWNEEMCERLGVPASLLPQIYPCHKVVGTITAKAAKETGLAEGTPVVAGGLDACCGTLGAGVIRPGETQEQGGQAGGMSICMDTYHADIRLILSYHVVPGKWLLQGGTVGGGGVMRWLEQELGDYEKLQKSVTGKSALEQFNEIASKTIPGSDGLVFLPYMAGERSPLWNPKAKGVYYGLDFSKTKGHFIRSAMEGVAFSLRHNLEVAKEAGVTVDVMKAIGGAANSKLWTQIKADVTNKRIVVPYSDSATSLGACILAGVGVGMYESFEQAVALTVKETRVHEPNKENAGIYEKNFKKYLEIYEQLKPVMNETEEAQ